MNPLCPTAADRLCLTSGTVIQVLMLGQAQVRWPCCCLCRCRCSLLRVPRMPLCAPRSSSEPFGMPWSSRQQLCRRRRAAGAAHRLCSARRPPQLSSEGPWEPHLRGEGEARRGRERMLRGTTSGGVQTARSTFAAHSGTAARAQRPPAACPCPAAAPSPGPACAAPARAFKCGMQSAARATAAWPRSRKRSGVPGGSARISGRPRSCCSCTHMEVSTSASAKAPW